MSGVTSPRSTSGSGMQQTSAGGIARLLLLALSAALATSEVRGCVAWQTCCAVVGGSGGSRSNSVSLRRRDLVFKSLLTGGAIAVEKLTLSKNASMGPDPPAGVANRPNVLKRAPLALDAAVRSTVISGPSSILA